MLPNVRRVAVALGLASMATMATFCGPSAAPPSDAPAPAEASEPARPQPPDPWEDARTRGIDFRALGQEPGWFLEIDRERWIRFFYDYAERQATTPVPQPERRGTTTTYDAATDAHHLQVVIEEAPCMDVMSGEAFPNRVTVVLDGRRFDGCGRTLADAANP
jgi:putative lipoprotein